MPVDLSLLAAIGDASLPALWLPLAVWTLIAGAALLLDDRVTLARPRLRHDVLVALMVALPFGLALGAIHPTGIALPSPAPAAAAEAIPTSVSRSGEPTSLARPSPMAGDVAPPLTAAAPADRPQAAPPSPIFLPPLLGALTLLAGLGAVLGFAGWIAGRVRLGVWIAGLDRCSASASREPLRLARSLVDVEAEITFVRNEVTPFTWGVWRPRIVVPLSLADDPDALRLALLHESAHVRSRDPLWDAAARLARSLVWWHPLARGSSAGPRCAASRPPTLPSSRPAQTTALGTLG